MERACEEAKKESARSSARLLGRPGSERGQEAREQTKRPQGRPGQKPQEEYCRPAQRSTATTRTPKERMSAAEASIRARFGQVRFEETNASEPLRTCRNDSGDVETGTRISIPRARIGRCLLTAQASKGTQEPANQRPA
jgi:hypothetical protein